MIIHKIFKDKRNMFVKDSEAKASEVYPWQRVLFTSENNRFTKLRNIGIMNNHMIIMNYNYIDLVFSNSKIVSSFDDNAAVLHISG